jgi:hypothetical protein
MNVPLLTQTIIDQLRKAKESGVMQHVIYLNNLPSKVRHEFLFFIKPEITLGDNQINHESILDLMFRKLKEFSFEIHDIRLLGASYLEKFNIISQHYGVINSISRNATGNLTPEGTGRFREYFGIMPKDAIVLGGIEFLEKYKHYDPFSLDELWQKSKAVKLAGGTYCALVTEGPDQIYLMNGFHPKQLVHFTEKGRSIVTFNLGSDIDWALARNHFIGKTNPSDAAQGSLRRELLENKSKFGLDEVNSSKNGFHLSAGPVEGLVELMRYCSDYSSGNMRTHDDFGFGRKLNASFSPMQVTKICANSYVNYNGNRISTFDLTEEKNADDALILLKESRID